MTVCPCLADNREVKVTGVVGEWMQTPDMTGQQVEDRALLEAKKNALRQAGVPEKVWSVFGMLETETSSTFMEAYSNVSFITINGNVNVLSQSQEWILKGEGDMKMPFRKVTIDASVRVNDDIDEDPAFAVSVSGISPVYNDSTQLHSTFQVFGSDYFLKVFYFNDKEAMMVYPHPSSPESYRLQYQRDEIYDFPVKGAKVTMTKSDQSVDVEHGLMIYVATKNNRPYVGGNDPESILQWIFGIPADERAFKLIPVKII